MIVQELQVYSGEIPAEETRKDNQKESIQSHNTMKCIAPFKWQNLVKGGEFQDRIILHDRICHDFGFRGFAFRIL